MQQRVSDARSAEEASATSERAGTVPADPFANCGQPERLRDALRLVFDAPTAARLARRAGGAVDADGLSRVVRAARRAIWRGRLPGPARGEDDSGDSDETGNLLLRRHDVGLAPRHLALALHLGIDLDGDRLARLGLIRPGAIGRDLLAARRDVDPAIPAPCAEFADSLGRYRDRALDVQARAHLITHVAECGRCGVTLTALRTVDEKVLGALIAPTPQKGRHHSPRAVTEKRREPVRRAATLFVLACVVVAAVLLARSVFSSAPRSMGNSAEGWLILQAPDRQLSAVDVASGRRVALPEPSADAEPAHVELSPNGRLVARWLVSPEQPSSASIQIAELDGRLLGTHRWDSEDEVYSLSGWLDDANALVVASPAPVPGETQLNYLARARDRSRLLAIDALTGDERLLYTGDVEGAFPSPDGSLLALRQRYDPAWPGFTLELRPVRAGQVGDPIAVEAHDAAGSVVWSPDSRRLYASRLLQPEMRQDASPIFQSGLLPRDRQRMDVIAIDRTGNSRSLSQIPADESISLLGVSPDDHWLIFSTMLRQSNAQARWRVLRAPLDANAVTSPIDLFADPDERTVQPPVWSPDARLMLLSVSAAGHGLDATMTGDSGGSDLVTFDRSWQQSALETPAADPEAQILAWIRPDALPDRVRSAAVLPISPQSTP
jgi:hypothetical protein